MSMRRVRAPITNGYIRKTVTLPADLVKRIDDYLESVPGLTMSSFLTSAGEQYADKLKVK